jgi:hypothetical protein
LPATSRVGENAFTLLLSPVQVVAEMVLLDPPGHRRDGLRFAAPRGGPPGFDPLFVSLRV